MKYLFVIAFLVSVSAYGQKISWEEAQSANTVEDYKYFQESNPKSSHYEEASIRIEQLTQARLESVKSIISAQRLQINYYRANTGKLTLESFFNDGWNFQDPFLGILGITDVKSNKAGSIITLGINDIDRWYKALRPLSDISLIKYSLLNSDAFRDGITVDITVQNELEVCSLFFNEESILQSVEFYH